MNMKSIGRCVHTHIRIIGGNLERCAVQSDARLSRKTHESTHAECVVLYQIRVTARHQ